MKLIGIVTNVNHNKNKNLIGQIIEVKADLESSTDNELCYREFEDFGRWRERELIQCFGILHSVSNIEIIGVL